MKKMIIVSMAWLLIVPVVHAIASPRPTVAAKSALKTHIVTDKLVYAPGELVIAAVEFENLGTQELSRYLQGDSTFMGRSIRLTTVKLDNGMNFSQYLGELPVGNGFKAISGKNTYYSHKVFALVDELGKPLPEGVYVLSVAQPPFINKKTNQIVYPTEAPVYIFVGKNTGLTN